MSNQLRHRTSRILVGLLTGFLAFQVAPSADAQKGASPTGGGGGGGQLMARFRSRPALPAVGEESLTVQFRSRSFGPVSSVLWDFGDGTTSSENNPTHTFGDGVFDISLTVFGPGGTTDTFLVSAGVTVEAVGAPPDGDDGGGDGGAGGDAGGEGEGEGGTEPLEIPPPLSSMEVPLPANLADFVKDEQAAITLGKALFWDIQLGSDGLTACASCHYHAGSDHRFRNTLHPGADGQFDIAGPNHTLSAADFPFHKFVDAERGDDVLSTHDDVRGSQGVTTRDFVSVDSIDPVDRGSDVMDDTFTLDGLNTLRVTSRKTPTNIGAIFFDRLFWDGRANNKFNGVNIWGDQDSGDPVILEMIMDNTLNGTLTEASIELEDAALASQAVGPPVSSTEMSWEGRSWADIGTKMVHRAPLANQMVDPSDSILGPLANLSGPGLLPGTTYLDLIAPAIEDRWWASTEKTLEGVTQLENNFSMIFGLAVMMYQSTLIPDQTPFDSFAAGDTAALTDEELRGLDIFIGKGKCIDCHGGSFLAGAVNEDIASGEGSLERMSMAHAVSRISARASSSPVPGQFPFKANPWNKQVIVLDSSMRRVIEATIPPGPFCQDSAQDVTVSWEPNHNLFGDVEVEGGIRVAGEGCEVSITLEARWGSEGPTLPEGELTVRWGSANFRLPSPVPSAEAVYDNGFYNIGVSETSQDLGAGDDGPFGPLSLTLRAQLLGEDHGFSGAEPTGEVSSLERVAVSGSFKVPTVRNSELTGPYFHNGSMATLDQVVEFYARGGNRFSENEIDLAPDVSGFDLIGTDKQDLIAFIKALTDHRVRSQSPPFDHPELPLKHGHSSNGGPLTDDGTGNAEPTLEMISMTGAGGGTDLQDFESLLAASATVAQTAAIDKHDDDGLVMAEAVLFLDLRPTDVVTFTLSSPDDNIIIFPSTIAFTPDNARMPVKVMITALDSTLSTTLVTSQASSGDPRFSGLDIPDIEVIF